MYLCAKFSVCACAYACTDACARQYVCELLHKCGGPHVRNGLVLVLASSLRHVCLRECLCLRPFSSMCFCTCALFRIASASLHEVCQHRPRVVSTRLCPTSWAIRESSARGASAKILVYMYIYIMYIYIYIYVYY